MNQIMKRIMAVGLVMVLVFGAAPASEIEAISDWLSVRASAATYSGDCGADGSNVTWSLDTETGELTISGTGAMADYLFDYSPWDWYNNSLLSSSVKAVTIDSGVTRIGSNAFHDFENLTHVALPQSLIEIGEGAFSGCTRLEKITIPGSVKTIDRHAFYGDYNLAEVTLEEGVETVFFGAFGYCGFTSFHFPASLTCVYGAFAGDGFFTWPNMKLQEITVDADNPNFTVIDGVLYSKDETELVVYPSAKPDAQFVIPNSVTTIKHDAFWGCTGLTSVTIPDSISSIGSRAFFACINVTAFTVSENNPSYSNDSNGVLYSKNKDALLFYPVGKSPISVSILDGVTSIGGCAFSECVNLTSITIPSSVKSIDVGAFNDCLRLATVCYDGKQKSDISIIPAENESLYYYSTWYFHKHDEQIETEVRNAIAPTCTTDGYSGDVCYSPCGVLKQSGETLPANPDAHSYKTVGTVPTCQHSGSSTYTCIYCNKTYTEAYDRLPHQYNAVVTAPTATKGGYTTYTCSMCGKKVKAHETPPTGNEVYTITYNANGGTVQQQATYSKTYSKGGTITKYTPVRSGYTFVEWYPALPTKMPDRDLTAYAVWKPSHAHATTILNQQTPTCDASGSTGVVYCPTCNEVIDFGTTIPATGHAWNNGTVTTEATCTDTGVRAHTCKVCGTTEEETVSAWGHCYDNGLAIVDPTCVDEGEKEFSCAACGLTYTEPVPANGHSFDSGKVTTDSTCTEEGVKTFTCTVCGATRTEPVAVLGHNYTFAIETLPTCTVDGVMRYTCTRCGDTYTNPINAVHKYNAVRTEPTCTEDGAITYTCTVCGDVYADPIEKLGHQYEDTVISPTCSQKGGTVHTCSRCGDTYTTDETDMLPHTYGNWEWDTEPTMDTDGLLVKNCTVCGNRIEQVVDKTYLRFEVLADEETGQEYAVVTGLQEAYPDKIVVPAELAGTPVTRIAEYAFFFWTDDDEEEPTGYSFTEAEILAPIEELEEAVFGYCKKLRSVMLPDSLKVIGNHAFYGCSELQRIDLPEQVESIGDTAFAYCVNLQQVTLPQSLKAIGPVAFGRCKRMQQITLPDGIEYFGEAVFAQSGLLELTIPASLAEVEGVEFAGCPRMTAYHVDPANPSLMAVDGVLFDKTGKTLIAFPMGRGDTEYTVPDGVETIGMAAFDYVVGDEDVYDVGFVPASLQTVRLPSSLKTIGDMAFYGVTQMQSIDIPDGVTEIGWIAFAQCIGLKRVTIPAGIQTIGEYAFDECDSLQAVCYAGTSTSWNRISIGSYNDALKNAKRYYHRHDQASASLTGKIDPTCTAEGYTGSYTFDCGFVLGGGEVIPALGHTYRTETTAPTCEANGYTTYICTRCGNSYMDNVIDAIGHDYIVTKHKDATCTESGYDIYGCKHDSSHTYTQTIPVKGHDYKITVVAPTCTAKGYTTHTCTRCSDSYVTDEKAAIGHAWDSGKVTKAATCTEEGVRTFTCTHDSSHTRTESIPATGHSFGAWTRTKAPTVYAEGVETQACSKCGAKNTRSIPKLATPKVNIQNFTASSKAYDYRSTITFKATVENPLTGGQIHWFVDGKEVGTGDSYTAENVKQGFSLQAKYYADSKEIPEAATEVEKVNVSTGFGARLKAFFRSLFGLLPKVTQEYLGIEIIDRIFPE